MEFHGIFTWSVLVFFVFSSLSNTTSWDTSISKLKHNAYSDPPLNNINFATDVTFPWLFLGSWLVSKHPFNLQELSFRLEPASGNRRGRHRPWLWWQKPNCVLDVRKTWSSEREPKIAGLICWKGFESCTVSTVLYVLSILYNAVVYSLHVHIYIYIYTFISTDIPTISYNSILEAY